MTQHQKIVAIMCSNKTKQWWKAADIMNAREDNLFIGYETSARLSEVVQDYPYMFEIKREGRFRLVRMRFETGKEWWPKLPREMKEIVRRYYRKG